MPHFIIDCSESITILHLPKDLMKAVHEEALSTGLFAKSGEGAIKVRIQAYRHFSVAEKKEDFVHVFGYIMEGRTDEQKKELSTKIVKRLKSMLPDVSTISMNIIDFDKASYTNRSMV